VTTCKIICSAPGQINRPALSDIDRPIALPGLELRHAHSETGQRHMIDVTIEAASAQVS